MFGEISGLLPISLDRAAICVEFVYDCNVGSANNPDAVEYWLSVIGIQSLLVITNMKILISLEYACYSYK